MKFVINKPKENIVRLARKIGYRPLSRKGEEFNCVRSLGGRGGYPRFHVFIKQDKEKGVLFFNLHLDQKKPSYSGAAAHSGEYEGEVIEKETERIKKAVEGFK